MGRILNKNRDPKINEFGPDDLVINTETGDIFAKANNRIFKILGRSQFDQSTTDALLKLLEASTDTTGTGSFDGFNTVDGFYGVVVTKSTTGSNVSLHGGVPFDYGQPLPNPPYIKSTNGFSILMDSAGSHNNSSFRVYKDTGVPGLGTELLELDNNGNLTVTGTISGSGTSLVVGNITGSNISASSEVSANTIVVGSTISHIGDSDTKITFADDDINLSVAGKTAIDLTWDGTGGGDTREITFNESHEDFDVRIEGDTDANLLFTNAGTDKVGIGLNTPGEKLTVTGNISASGTIVGSTLTGTIDGGSF